MFYKLVDMKDSKLFKMQNGLFVVLRNNIIELTG